MIRTVEVSCKWLTTPPSPFPREGGGYALTETGGSHLNMNNQFINEKLAYNAQSNHGNKSQRQDKKFSVCDLNPTSDLCQIFTMLTGNPEGEVCVGLRVQVIKDETSICAT